MLIPGIIDSYITGGETWSTVGNAFSFYGDIAGVSSSRIYTMDIAGSGAVELSTIDFDESDWSQTGNAFSFGVHDNDEIRAIGALTSSRVMANLYFITFEITSFEGSRSYDFDESDFSFVGGDSFGSSSTFNVRDLEGLSATDFVTVDNSGNVELWDFDGSDNTSLDIYDLSAKSGNVFSIAKMSSTRFAVFDDDNGEIQVFDVISDVITPVGNPYSIASTDLALAAMTSTRIAVVDATNSELYALDFDGTDLTQHDDIYNTGTITNVKATGLSSSRIAYVEDTSSTLVTIQLG